MIFIAFLWYKEFTWNTWIPQHHQSHFARMYIQFNFDHFITLTLSSSKTNSYHRDTIISLAFSLNLSSLCSITTFHHLFSLYPRSSTHSFFSCLYDQSFNKQFLIAKIREFLLHVDISSFGFSNHFIRRNAAIIVTLNDIFRDDIKLLECWKSDIVDNYLDSFYQFNYIFYQFHLNT